MYAWNSRNRLCPPRMIWLEHNYNDHKFELARMHKRRLRAYNKLGWKRESKVEYHHWKYRIAAGILGEWPLYKPHKRVKKINVMCK